MTINTETQPATDTVAVSTAVTLAHIELLVDIEEGLSTLSRDAYLSRIGDVCIATQLHPDRLPEPIRYAWQYARALKDDDRLIAKGLAHVFRMSLELADPV